MARRLHEPPSPLEWSWQEFFLRVLTRIPRNVAVKTSQKTLKSYHAELVHSLAEGEVGLVACCHAAPFSAASFSGVTRRWGRCRHVFVPCRHSATASCCHLVLGAVVFVTSLLHPGALFGQAQWIVFILQKRRIFLKTKQFQGYDLKIEKRLKVLWRQEWEEEFSP